MPISKDTIWLNSDELFTVFRNYPTKDAMYKAIQRGSFPVKTFRIGNKIYADKVAVVEYFRRQRESAMQALEASS